MLVRFLLHNGSFIITVDFDITRHSHKYHIMYIVYTVYLHNNIVVLKSLYVYNIDRLFSYSNQLFNDDP